MRFASFDEWSGIRSTCRRLGQGGWRAEVEPLDRAKLSQIWDEYGFKQATRAGIRWMKSVEAMTVEPRRGVRSGNADAVPHFPREKAR